MFMVALFTLLNLSPASAEDCDSKALTQALKDSTSITSAQAYLDLAACDADSAKKLTPMAFKMILSGPEGNKAAIQAVELDHGPAVREWLGAMPPDEKESNRRRHWQSV